MDLKKFVENAKKIKKVKDDFNTTFNCEIYLLKESLNRLNENEHSYIYNELIKIDIDKISFPQIGRLQTILSIIEQQYLKKYFEYLASNYIIKDLPSVMEKPTMNDKNDIVEYNKFIKQWRQDTDYIKMFNNKIKTLNEYLTSIITIDLYGDTTMNVDTYPYIYFKFFNTDIDEIEVFIQELKTIPIDATKKIISVRIYDILALTPNFLKSADEVRFYFQKIEDAEELRNLNDYIYSVYEKYIIKNNIMKKNGGEYGLFNERKDNLNNSTDNSYTNITPITLNSGNVYIDESFYNKDYEVDISECYYASFMRDGNIFYSIVPKVFYDKYETLLDNSNMIIIGITDDKKWYRDGVLFKSYLSDIDSEKYLQENCYFSQSLLDFLDGVDIN